jgi:hypothetical protein
MKLYKERGRELCVYEYVEMPETPFLDPYSYLLLHSNLFSSSPLGVCFRVPRSSPAPDVRGEGVQGGRLDSSVSLN